MKWRIELFGTFKLINPAGSEIALPTRKVEELLALFVVNEGQQLNRNDVSRWIWPSSTHKAQLESLRKAVSLLKKSTGETVVIRIGSALQLHPRFAFTSDWDEFDCKVENWDSFMIGHKGPWSSQMRYRGKVSLKTGPVVSLAQGEQQQVVSGRFSPCRGLYDLISFYLETEPTLVIELLRKNQELVIGFNLSNWSSLLSRLSTKIEETSPSYGWILLWLGLLETPKELLGSVKLLEKALLIAKEFSDSALFGETSFWLSTNYLLLGNSPKAAQVAEQLELEGVKSEDPLIISKAKTVQALIQIHTGNQREAFLLFEMAKIGLENHFVTRSIIICLEALFRATNESPEKAEALLPEVEYLVSQADHIYLELLIRLVRLAILMKRKRYSSALSAINDLIILSIKFEQTHFELYARETQIVACLKINNKGDASLALEEVKKIRLKLGIHLSVWDFDRLGLLKARAV